MVGGQFQCVYRFRERIHRIKIVSLREHGKSRWNKVVQNVRGDGIQ